MVSSLIFQKFSGEGLTEPLPRPLPPLFLGLCPRFGLRPQFSGARALDSGFALDTRALRVLDSGFALNFRLRTLFCLPPNKFLDPPLSGSGTKTEKLKMTRQSVGTAGWGLSYGLCNCIILYVLNIFSHF